MKCVYCSNEIPAGVSNCPYCGSPAAVSPSPASPGMTPIFQSMRCPNCKAQIPYGMSVCPMCNARLNTATVLNDSNGTAVAAFVMALLSIAFPILTIPAIVCGHIGLNYSKRVSGHTGQGLAVAAMAIGYITVAVWLLILLGAVGGCAALMGLAR